MASSLSNVSNLSKEIHRIKCKYGQKRMIKKVKFAELNYKYRDCFLEYNNFKDNLIEHKCCNKIYQQRFDEKLKERFFNTYKFSNHDNNKSIFLLRNGVYPYEYMDDWEKFIETLKHHEKEDSYSHLNM